MSKYTTARAIATALLGVATFFVTASSDAHAQTGYNCLFIGHSFFRPFAEQVPFHATQAGIVGHTQNVVFRGGPNGAPEALWNDPVARAEIQGYLDAGDVEVFGMTIHGDYPGLTGYINWFDYALAQNPNTRFMLALPWLPQPASYTASAYESAWHATHGGLWQDFLDTMRALYPGVDIFNNPYGQSAVELRLLLDAGNLPGVTAVQGPAATSIHTDTLGHAGDILKDLGELVWLNVIYDVDLLTYSYSPPWATDLNAVAQAIMDAHDAEYEPGPLSSDDEACINEANKNLAKVAQITHKWQESCLKDQSKGKTASTEDCIALDGKGRIFKATLKASSKVFQKCTAADPQVLDLFFGTDIDAASLGDELSEAAQSKEELLLAEFFGSDIDSTVASATLPAKCQQKVLKDLFKCQDTKLKEFNKCKKQALKGGVSTPRELSNACLGLNGSGPGQPDPGGKIAKTCNPALGVFPPSKLAKAVLKNCTSKSVALETVFPGTCASADDQAVADCVEAKVECAVCTTLNTFESTVRNCDEFDDGVSNGSCP